MADHMTLQSVGEAIYGQLWRSQMARDLKVSERTVRRWANGSFPVPDNVWNELRFICTTRQAALARLVRALAPR